MVTAANSSGTVQVLNYTGSWGEAFTGHVVTVNFFNDVFAGVDQDRNLHVQNITVDGCSITLFSAAKPDDWWTCDVHLCGTAERSRVDPARRRQPRGRRKSTDNKGK